MHRLCYRSDEVPNGLAGDAELAAVIEDGSVPMALVAELYPLDYNLLTEQLKSSLTGPESGTRIARFMGQRHDMMRLMDELNHAWQDHRTGAYSPATPIFALSDEDWKKMVKGLERVLKRVYLQPGRLHGDKGDKGTMAQWDAKRIVEFFINLAAGEAFGERCIQMSITNGGHEQRNFEQLERYFEAVLTSKVNVRRKKNHDAKRAGAA
jgi:hypothetical protein